MRTTSRSLPNTLHKKSQFCLHLSTGYFQAPKVCLLDRECYHCAYDQWLDYPETRDCKDEKRLEKPVVFFLDPHESIDRAKGGPRDGNQKI